jgi:DNA-binding transcriptional ArsR family regulator
VPGLSGGRAAADERAGAVFAARADPTRRAMVRALRAEPSTASRMAGDLPMTRQAVAKHLAALRDAGLVEAHREGRETRYVLTPAPLADAMAWMAETGGIWDERLARLAERASRA